MATEEMKNIEISQISINNPGSPPHLDMVWIPGGSFHMGSEDFYPEEGPVHQVSVDGFRMDKYQVTNADIRKFIRATGYRPSA